MGDSLSPQPIPTPQIDDSSDASRPRDRSVNQLGVANSTPGRARRWPAGQLATNPHLTDLLTLTAGALWENGGTGRTQPLFT